MNQSNSNGLEYKKQFSILAFVILHSCMNLPTAFITCLSRFFIKLRKVIHFDWGLGGRMSRLISIQFSTLIFDDLKRLNYTLKRHKNVP